MHLLCFQQCRRYVGGQGGRATLTTACAPPHLGLLRKRFWTSLYDKTTDNNGKKKTITLQHNSCLKSSRFFAKLPGTQLLCINMKQ